MIWQQDGSGPQALLGSGVGLVGDVNGEGVPDQVAAAPGAGATGLGEAYVYSGVDGTILLTLNGNRTRLNMDRREKKENSHSDALVPLGQMACDALKK